MYLTADASPSSCKTTDFWDWSRVPICSPICGFTCRNPPRRPNESLFDYQSGIQEPRTTREQKLSWSSGFQIHLRPDYENEKRTRLRHARHSCGPAAGSHYRRSHDADLRNVDVRAGKPWKT